MTRITEGTEVGRKLFATTSVPSVIVSNAVEVLTAAGIPPEDARRDAVLLARHRLGWDAARWLTDARSAAPAGFEAAFRADIARRARREPLAYITGEREFYGRSFLVTPDVLIPRQETELLVEEAFRVRGDGGQHRPSSELADLRPLRDAIIVDVGTGSGCLGITLALEWPDAHIAATDVSPAALDVARANAERFGVAERIELLEGAWLGRPDLRPWLVVANPPYVAERDRATLAPEVRDYEPAEALFGGPDGLDAIRQLVPAAARALAPGGWLLMEIGAGQDREIAGLVADAGLTLRRIVPDLQSIPRVVVAQLPLLQDHRG